MHRTGRSAGGATGTSGAFAALLSRDISDPLTSFHLKRLLAGATGVAVTLE
jgi:hypothetical protein